MIFFLLYDCEFLPKNLYIIASRGIADFVFCHFMNQKQFLAFESYEKFKIVRVIKEK